MFPKPELEKVLGKTLGVPLFQEQAMQVAMVAAGFSASEADQLRRAMATFKFTGGVNKFRGQADPGHDRQRLDERIRRADVQATRRLRLLRFPGKPRRKLCADRLRLKLDEMPSSRCVLRRDPQCPANGILRSFSAGA